MARLADLPLECLFEIASHLPPASFCSVRLVCAEFAARLDLSAELCARTWRVRPAEADARETYIARFRAFRAICSARLAPAMSAWVRTSGSNSAAYSGADADAHSDRSVGVATAAEPLPAWPFGGPEDAGFLPAAASAAEAPLAPRLEMSYYEVTVTDAGERGCISVGWCRADYPALCKQPGWERHSYGWHGDDGRAYHATGWGWPFSSAFKQGDVVGTGLVRRWGPGARGAEPPCSASIFYTLNGEFVGMPFREVRAPQLLLPAVGLHSAREAVSLEFGLCDAPNGAGGGEHGQSALQLHPRDASRRFRFDLERMLSISRSLLLPPAARAQPPAGLGAAGGGGGGPSALLGSPRAASGLDGGSEGDPDDPDLDEGYAAVFRRVADVNDTSVETHAEISRFLRANFSIPAQVLEALSMQALREICEVVLTEMAAAAPESSSGSEGGESSGEEDGDESEFLGEEDGEHSGEEEEDWDESESFGEEDGEHSGEEEEGEAGSQAEGNE